MKLNIGDKVIKNEATWIPSAFDGWGRGIGVGIVIESPFELYDDDEFVFVRWPAGRCFEDFSGIIKVDSEVS